MKTENQGRPADPSTDLLEDKLIRAAANLKARQLRQRGPLLQTKNRSQRPPAERSTDRLEDKLIRAAANLSEADRASLELWISHGLDETTLARMTGIMPKAIAHHRKAVIARLSHDLDLPEPAVRSELVRLAATGTCEVLLTAQRAAAEGLETLPSKGDHRRTGNEAFNGPERKRDLEELKNRAARGLVWTLLGAVGQRGVLYMSTLVLVHLLHPADFGLIAIASTLISASTILRDLGLGDTLIQRPNLDRMAQGTVLTLMLLSGLLMAGLLAVLAPVLASFFHNPRLTNVLLALAPILALGGFVGFYDNVLQRELQYGYRTYVSACQSTVYVVISLTMALAGFGVWSLIVAQLASLVTAALLQLRLAAGFVVRPRFESSAARETLRMGRAFLVGGAVDFARQNTDYISIGRFLSAAQLSFYFSAFRVCETLGGAIADAFTKISFSSFSRLRAQGADLRANYLSTTRLVALVSCPIGVLLSGLAGPFVRTAYGKQWLPMISVLSVLGLWLAVRVLENLFAWLLISVGQTALSVKVTTLSYVGLLPSIIAAASLSGIVAVAWVMLSYTVGAGAAFVWLLARNADLPPSRQWRALRPIVIACVPTWLASRGVSMAIPIPVVALPLAALAGLGAYLATLAVVEPGLLRWALRQAQRVLRRSGGETPPAVAPEGAPMPT